MIIYLSSIKRSAEVFTFQKHHESKYSSSPRPIYYIFGNFGNHFSDVLTVIDNSSIDSGQYNIIAHVVNYESWKENPGAQRR